MNVMAGPCFRATERTEVLQFELPASTNNLRFLPIAAVRSNSVEPTDYAQFKSFRGNVAAIGCDRSCGQLHPDIDPSKTFCVSSMVQLVD